MKKAGVACFFLLGMVLSAFSFEVASVRMVPLHYYVGDRVEMQILLKDIEEIPGDIQLESPDSVLEIYSTSIDKTGANTATIHIVFSSFFPGGRTFPEIRVNDHTIDSLKIYTNSLVAEGYRTLSEPRGQMMLPASRLYITLMVLVLLLSPVVLFFVLKYLYRLLSLLLRVYQRYKPVKEFKKGLQTLREGPFSNSRMFYDQITDLIRSYLEKRTGQDCRSATTRELKKIIQPLLEGALAASVLDMFRYADVVRFSDREATHEIRMNHLDLAEQLLNEMEGK